MLGLKSSDEMFLKHFHDFQMRYPPMSLMLKHSSSGLARLKFALNPFFGPIKHDILSENSRNRSFGARYGPKLQRSSGKML